MLLNTLTLLSRTRTRSVNASLRMHLIHLTTTYWALIALLVQVMILPQMTAQQSTVFSQQSNVVTQIRLSTLQPALASSILTLSATLTVPVCSQRHLFRILLLSVSASLPKTLMIFSTIRSIVLQRKNQRSLNLSTENAKTVKNLIMSFAPVLALQPTTMTVRLL